MNSLLTLNKNNKRIIFTYLIVLTVTLFGLFFMVVYKEGFDQKNLYMYSFLFQILTYSFFISMWEVEGLKTGDLFFQIFLLTICAVPHLIVVGAINNINGKQLLLPILIQYLWGIAIVSIKSLLNTKLQERFTANLILRTFIFAVIFLTLIFLYYYYHYINLVLTTIFDKRIPIIFFLNPILNTAGIIDVQLGGANHLGYKPVYLFCIFWAGISAVNFYIKNHLSRRSM